jgi:hypothetical protein
MSIVRGIGSGGEGTTTMGDPKEDLRATSESIQQDARKVEKLEKEKTALDPEDPEVQVISKKVESVIGAMQEKASAETDLSNEIGAST